MAEHVLDIILICKHLPNQIMTQLQTLLINRADKEIFQKKLNLA